MLRGMPAAFAIAIVPFAFYPRVAAQEHQQVAEVQSILREAATLVPKVEPDQRPSAAANVARLQVLAGDLEGGLATAETVSGRPDRWLPVNSMAWALTAQGNAPLALKLITDRTEGAARASVYLQLSQQLAGKGDFAGALETARLIQGDAAQKGTFVTALMRIYTKQQEAHDQPGAAKVLNEAVALVEDEAKVPSISKPAIAEMYLSIVRGLAEAGNLAEAAAFVDHISDLAEQAEDPGENRVLLRDLGYAEAEAGEFLSALHTAGELPTGNERDAILQAVAMTQAKRGDADGVLEAAAGLSSQDWRLGCVRMAAEALAAAKNYPRALVLLDGISDGKDRAYALAELALQQAEKEDPAAAFTVQLAWETALDARPKTEHFVFEYIAVTRGILGDFAGALAIVNDLDEKSRVWPLWNLTDMMVAAGRKDEALALAKAQKSPHARVYALMGLASGLLDRINKAHNAGSGK